MEGDLPDDEAFRSRIRDLLRLIRPMRAVGAAKKRYGRDYDGGYVMLDSIERARVCYSLGISDDVSWDLVMAGFGSQIYMYDHTVAAAPQDHPQFHFQKLGIAPSDDLAPDLRSLETLIRTNGHARQSGMILKMDIESWEWACFAEVNPDILRLFDQIVCEFHHTRMFRKESWLSRAEKAFARLHETHQVVHVHGNNNLDMNDLSGFVVPEVFELTYARRGTYDFVPTSEMFPGELDMPCTPAKPDLLLGSFIF